jgi:DNA-binding CsgD family transcriptional regulator
MGQFVRGGEPALLCGTHRAIRRLQQRGHMCGCADDVRAQDSGSWLVRHGIIDHDFAALEADLEPCTHSTTLRGLPQIVDVPLIVTARDADNILSVSPARAGVLRVLDDPLFEEDMVDGIGSATRRHLTRRPRSGAKSALERRFAALTARERQVMLLVASGLMNKQIAAELDISVPTVKFHRSAVMKKMAADSLAILVRMAAALETRAP